MAVQTVTGKQIRQGLVEYGDWVFLGTQVGVTGASTTAIPDAERLKGLNLPSTMFDNCIVRIASGLLAGETSNVDYLDNVNGILYLTPALTGTLATNDEYEIWLRGIDPDIVDRLRDDCLQKFCSQWRVVPLTVVPNGDMEKQGNRVDVAIVSSTDASPIAMTTATHGLQTGDEVFISGHLVNTNANGSWKITRTSATAFTLDGSVALGAGVGGATGYVGSFTAAPHWTIAATATRSIVFSQFPNAHSRHVLRVGHVTAATDYVKSDPIDVNPGEKFFLQVQVSAYVTATPASPATASIVVQDLTNAAAVTLSGLKTSHIGKRPGWISLTWTVPVGCYQIELRLSTDTASSTTVWGGIACHVRENNRVSLPDRITSRKRVGTFYSTTSVQTVEAQADLVYKAAPFQSIERVQVGNQVEVYVNPPLGEFALYFYERGYFDRLSINYFTVAQRFQGDHTPTDIKLEYAIAALATRVAKFYLDKYGEDWQDDWVRASADFNYWEGQHGPEPKLVAEVESQIFIPNLSI